MEMEMEADRKKKSIMDDELKVALLPSEIITEILSRLPADSAVGCRCICKQWRSLIDDLSFRDTHTQQLTSSSFSPGNQLIPNSSSSGLLLFAKQDDNDRYILEVIEYNDVAYDGDENSVLRFKPSKPITYYPFPFLYHIWGSLKISSCNGLVFMGSDNPNTNAYVCNPFTKEYVCLRRLRHCRGSTLGWPADRLYGYMAYGFGYLPSTNEYKVVSIYYDNTKIKGKVGVYTLGSGKWRNKGVIPFSIINTPFSLGGFANGAIHWFTNNQQLVSFDLADEEFRLVVPLQPHGLPTPNYDVTYTVFGGCLCVIRSYTSRRDIWVLTANNNNSKEEFSWNKKLSLPIWKEYTDKATPKVVTKSGKILLCCGSLSDLVSYDPKTEKFVYGKSFPSSKWVKIIPYTKSFVSLKALGEEDAKCFARVCRCEVVQAQALA